MSRIPSPNTSCRLNDSDPACDPGVRLFGTAFDELCAWIFNLLHDGFILPMTEISIEYKIILNRRKENCTESMIRTSNIRSRLETKYGSTLHFEKTSNYDVSIHLPRLLFALIIFSFFA